VSGKSQKKTKNLVGLEVGRGEDSQIKGEKFSAVLKGEKGRRPGGNGHLGEVGEKVSPSPTSKEKVDCTTTLLARG